MEPSHAAQAADSGPKVLKNGIIVAGHPRSGTSLACQLLESAGVTFPSDLGSDEYNKFGYFELETGKELEKKLLDKAMTPENVASMNVIIDQLNRSEGLSGLKVVHIPALFFYRHVAKNLRVVFIYRNPADVKSSMFRRGISQFRLSWLDNNNALVAGYENIPKSVIISYESLIARKDSVRRAFRKLGFQVNLDVIKSEEQTQKNSRLVVSADEARLHRLLRKLERESAR